MKSAKPAAYKFVLVQSWFSLIMSLVWVALMILMMFSIIDYLRPEDVNVDESHMFYATVAACCGGLFIVRLVLTVAIHIRSKITYFAGFLYFVWNLLVYGFACMMVAQFVMYVGDSNFDAIPGVTNSMVKIFGILLAILYFVLALMIIPDLIIWLKSDVRQYFGFDVNSEKDV